MLLLDRILDFEENKAVAEAIPRSNRWYSNSAGNMPAWIGIELMAQTVAAHIALKKRQENLPVKMGALLGTRQYRPARSSFFADVPLSISVHMILRDPSGLGAYDCSIASDDDTIAVATLKVYEPEDFKLFLQENLS